MPNSTDLRRAGLKATSPRVKILDILAAGTDHGRHLSAEEVYRQLLSLDIDIGISTVYRVLNQLVDAGVLLRHTFEAGHAVYEINEGTHHDHLICLTCGRVEEFHDDAIESRQESVAAERGFVLREHALALYGVCPACQAHAGAVSAVGLNA
ncbi:ferric iron uptake transcriptional regulator [Ralstonia solanacearum]|nr:ferric iron uptake transcriptional regulator [Ralstonia solanacearum]AMP72245.1 Fur family transcriptional regulator [Ralstonia solanacearum]AMP76844.1 Fur family transcriptional regulator [Ralstonia solanacearum]AYB62369.1 ferric iron uptake transcriptional regulator [Ralstonia solanacearum]EUJ13165.1 Fur family transcriptional regulator [Ralstonia solanacearum P673]MBB6589445.1 ferric iron uptake transcriptional regulator [Ralstonia solanacearum]